MEDGRRKFARGHAHPHCSKNLLDRDLRDRILATNSDSRFGDESKTEEERELAI